MIKFFKKYKLILLFFSILIFSDKVFSQTDCENAYVEATKEFENGNYQKVIELLKERITTCDFSRETKLQIYKLLASSYSEIDDIENSEKYIYKFIKKHPEYNIQSTDAVTFTNAFNKYSIRPNWIVGLDVQLMETQFNVMKSYRVVYDTKNYSSIYHNKNSLILNIHIQKQFSNLFALTFDFTQYNLKLNRDVVFSDNYRINYREHGFIFSFSNNLKTKLFKIKNIGFFYNIGWYAYNYNDPNFELYYYYGTETSEIKGTYKEERLKGNLGFNTGFSIEYQRERINFKIKYALNNDFLPINNPATRYSNPDFIIDYYYIDDDIRLSQNIILIGVSYNLFYKIKHKYK